MVASEPGLACAALLAMLLPLARSSPPSSHSTIITGQPGLGQGRPARAHEWQHQCCQHNSCLATSLQAGRPVKLIMCKSMKAALMHIHSASRRLELRAVSSRTCTVQV